MAPAANALSESERRMRSVLAVVVFVLFWAFVIGLGYVATTASETAIVTVSCTAGLPMIVLVVPGTAAWIPGLGSLPAYTRKSASHHVGSRGHVVTRIRETAGPAEADAISSRAAVVCRNVAMPFVFATAMVLSASAAVAAEPQSVAARLEPSIVHVFTVSAEDEGVSGTGFVVSGNGHVATNFHVIAPHVEADWNIFLAASGTSPEDRLPATLIAAFPGEDLAVLQVEELRRPAVQLGEASVDRPAKGASLFTVGFAGAGGRLGVVHETSFTTGTVSRVFTGSWSEEAPQILIIQHTAPTNPGNSGGPIANACGQVVGVNSQREMAFLLGPGGIPIVTDVIQGVFFASHVSVLMEKLTELGVPYSASRRPCQVFFGVASTHFPWFAALAAHLAAALAFLVAIRPRPVVQVCVRCGCAARDCAKAVARAVRKAR